VTTSKADPAQPYGVTCGGASLFGTGLPTTDPHQVTALSFDFNPQFSGPIGHSPRLVVCFSDGAGCDSNGSLGPVQWTANTFTHVDGFAPSDGATNVWSNSGGTCGSTYNTTWSAIISCHPGATITEVVVVNDAGSQYPAGAQVVFNNLTFNNVTANATQPILAQTATVVPVSGTVLVKKPGSKRFVPVKTVTTLHYGATVNTNNGRLRIFASKGRHGGTQNGVFYGGTFKLTQNTTGLVQAALTGHPTACGGGPVAHTAATRFRLFSHVSGKFKTRGRYGSAAVVGTIWVTQELCSGTFFHVYQGTIKVRDFTRHKTIILHAGHSYLARKP
jgi:hypothetical protein